MAEDRIQRFEKREAELKQLSDAQLKERFWELCNQLVEPIVELARTHTSPSIERSVLLRMGIDSVSSHGIVDHITEAGLLGKGAGHVVWRVSQKEKCDIRTAGKKIIDDKSVLNGLFEEKGA